MKSAPARSFHREARRRPGRPSDFDSERTRQVILDAAEELFAAFGAEGVSIRTINTAAGYAPTAVHRHFRSKDRLLEAVLRRRGDAVMARHMELFSALADGPVPTPADLVGVWAKTYYELIEREGAAGLRWMRLLGRLVVAQDPLLAKLVAQSGDLPFLRAAARTFPGVPADRLGWGLTIAFCSLVQTMANQGIWAPPDVNGQPRAKAKKDLASVVRFVASGLAELLSPEREPSAPTSGKSLGHARPESRRPPLA